jgi:amino acid transporter
MSDQPSLKRSLGLTQIVLYGAGTILGAGIYVLVGEVIGVSGNFAPMAFLLAALIVAFSAYSFGVLSAAFPVSAGPAAYTEEAFRSRGLATTVGYAIIASGVISAATITRGFVGYLDIFTTLPNWISICLFVTIMAAIALRGVNTSVGLAVAITLLEISGLVLVVISAWDKLPEAWHNLPRYFLPTQKVEFEGIAIGAFLAFYACIGFEDMVNMAEEVKNP